MTAAVTYEPALDFLRAAAERGLRSRGQQVSDLVLARHPRGISSFTYDVSWRDQRGGVTEGVLKAAPVGLPATGNRDVLREARLVEVLGPTPVPVAEVLLQVPGESEQPPFFIARRVAGDNLDPFLEGHDPGERDLSSIVRSAFEQARRLHTVPSGDLATGITETSLEDELALWTRVLASVPPTLVPRSEECAALLRATIPPPILPRVVHGDLRIGNLITADGGVRALIDWEMGGLGDARLDAAFLAVSCDVEHPFARPGLRIGATPGDLLASYSSDGGVPVDRPSWFLAFARFKQCAEVALLVHRAKRRGDDRIDVAAREAGLPRLLDAALADLEEDAS